MSVDNIVGLMFHGIFYTGVISHCHYYWVSNGSVYMNIPGIGRVITIWDKVFCKLRIVVDGLVRRKRVFSESSNRIDTHIDVVVLVIEVHISFFFDWCIDEEFIELWWADLMFQITHATNFCWLYTVHWWIPTVSRYQNGRVRRLWWILMGWRGLKLLIWSVIDVIDDEIIDLKYSSKFIIFS